MRRSRHPSRAVSTLLLAGGMASCASLSGLSGGDGKDAGAHDAGRLEASASRDASSSAERPRADAGVDARAPRRDASDGGGGRGGRDAGVDGAEDAGHDVAPRDAGEDGARDAPAQRDAASEAAPPCTPDDAGYTDFTDPGCWTSYPDPGGGLSYSGATFDGRYTYFLGNGAYGGSVTRYDTHGAFTSADSWAQYQFGGDGATFVGLVFDGRYVYGVPQASGFLRYDTMSSSGDGFGLTASWTMYSAAGTGEIAYAGAAFDGHYVYFIPYYSSADYGTPSGLIARFERSAPFTDAASWTTFDTSTLPDAPAGYFGSVFDGRYLYFIPDPTSGTAYIARFDTTLPFTTSSSWSTFSPSTVTGAPVMASTGVFDGRYVYIVPLSGSQVGLRYDTQQPFTTASSWTEYVIPGTSQATGFGVGAYDGRYVYYVPAGYTSPASVKVIRFDTTSMTFADAPGWTVYTPVIKHDGFQGAVFDGEYLYLAPSGVHGAATFARFQARGTPVEPALPDFFGSFF